LEKQKLKSGLKLSLKIILSAAAIYWVFRQLDIDEVLALIGRSNFLWLILAFLAFNLSKILSAERLLILFNCLDLKLDRLLNIKLYYVGMFYNLFLPGGVGGDGYKVYYLKKRSEAKTKLLLAAVLLDRISGAALLAGIALGIAIFSDRLYQFESFNLRILYAAGAILTVPSLLILIRFVFPSFKKVGLQISIWSVGVQLAQLVCAYSILTALGVDEHFNLYFVLFLVSSIAAMLPISIGGIGLRELVFLYASEILPIDSASAVALALMFFIITATSSLLGVFIKLPKQEDGITNAP
jgi:uncharacterized membrane protein YbhN (UPF0104 family)